MDSSEPAEGDGGGGEREGGGGAGRILFCCCGTIVFSITFSFLFSFLFGLAAITFESISSSSPALVPAACRIVSSGVDLRSSKVCELGLLNYKAKRVFYPSEKSRFRCRHDYYWASVFEVEYRELFSGEIYHAVVEAPREPLPHDCRPNFSTAWSMKMKFKPFRISGESKWYQNSRSIYYLISSLICCLSFCFCWILLLIIRGDKSPCKPFPAGIVEYIGSTNDVYGSDSGLCPFDYSLYKVNQTYGCRYTLGSHKAEIYTGNLFNCESKGPSTAEMIRRFFILFARLPLDLESCKRMMVFAVVGIVSGMLVAICMVIFIKSLRVLILTLTRRFHARRSQIREFLARSRRVCLFVAYFSAMGWLTLEYGKMIGVKQLFDSNIRDRIITRRVI